MRLEEFAIMVFLTAVPTRLWLLIEDAEKAAAEKQQTSTRIR